MSFGGGGKKVRQPPLPDPIPTAPTPQEAQKVQQRAEAERRRRAGKKGRAGTVLTPSRRGPGSGSILTGELNTKLGQT